MMQNREEERLCSDGMLNERGMCPVQTLNISTIQKRKLDFSVDSNRHLPYGYVMN